jgi:hypothetical protein
MTIASCILCSSLTDDLDAHIASHRRTDDRFSEALDEAADRVHIDRYVDELDQIIKRIEKVEANIMPPVLAANFRERLQLLEADSHPSCALEEVKERLSLLEEQMVDVHAREEKERYPEMVVNTSGEDFDKNTRVMREWLNHQGVSTDALRAELKAWLDHFQ